MLRSSLSGIFVGMSLFSLKTPNYNGTIVTAQPSDEQQYCLIVEQKIFSLFRSADLCQGESTKLSRPVLFGQPVNINTANDQDLLDIPGIGPSKAAAIIKSRESHGRFSTSREIVRVSGIGEKTFIAIQEFIVVK